ncbi:hypothetical protein [Amycolatopsis echigonensis]|uniref:Uncharacterized protein n=1 Tax=Amycolatopsis echigonensis TaxID=2576905 RepID=A0A8E2B8Z7_9PSEU|nr:hypothetical protein [Amycolatopsis echigonensis]MBB2506384.1 hypothetical protein [Amycolatopsis echigonensis]
MTGENIRPAARGHRAGTRRGRPAQRPDGAYDPDPSVQSTPAGLEVTVVGEDGRRAVFRFTRHPLPGLHPALAEAFARCTGPQGTLRTAASAGTVWGAVKRLLVSLATLAHPPATWAELTARHLDRFRLDRLTTANETSVNQEISQVRTVLRQIQPPELINEEARSWLDRRRVKNHGEPKSGYSDREFGAIMAAARSEVVAIRKRLEDGQRLLATFERDPGSLDIEQQKLAAVLKEIAATGVVPIIRLPHPNSGLRDRKAMLDLAKHLFVEDRDLGPLLTLAVGLSGRNVETIKDLTASHEVLEGRAVRAGLIKRRRGPSRMFETVHWEIGSPSQRLQTPGGFYLLLEQMMRLGRSFSGTESLWSIWVWRNDHIGAFDRSLNRGKAIGAWKSRHPLVGDDGAPLQISSPRLKKTVDVRTTRATGGHLPSSTRSNTMPVLFTNYLRGDASVQDWAGEVVTAALSDAEQDARISYARVLSRSADALPEPAHVADELNLSQSKAEQLLAGQLDTAFMACADIDSGPRGQGERCAVSFLMCFGCENSLVTHAHIPRLKALLEWLADQRDKVDLNEWWQRHGLTWLAITEHIRPKFSPAEWDAAPAADGLADLIALIDGPQETA